MKGVVPESIKGILNPLVGFTSCWPIDRVIN